MGALEDARRHLDKAREFLDSAVDELDFERYNAATSNAVTSGINSKDAICLKLTGRTNKTDNHGDAEKELEKSGPAGKELVPTLRRLLGLKSKAQYQTVGVARSQAQDAVAWAERLYDGAARVVTQ